MRSGGKTYFVRVDENNVVLVEVLILEEEPYTGSWFSDIHLQEVLLLLKGVLQNVAQLSSTGIKSTGKQTEGEIITGDRVRLGYSIKKRPTKSTCLIHSDPGLVFESTVVSADKLVVYVCQLVSSSPQRMPSKLLKMNSGPKTPSISSYFKKEPASTSGDQSTTGSAESSQSPGSLPQPPPSEGRHRAIHGILTRMSEDKKERKLKRRKISTKKHDLDKQKRNNSSELELSELELSQKADNSELELSQKADNSKGTETESVQKHGYISELSPAGAGSDDKCCNDSSTIEDQTSSQETDLKQIIPLDSGITGFPKYALEDTAESSPSSITEVSTSAEVVHVKKEDKDSEALSAADCSSVDSDVTSDLETTALPSASFVMKPTAADCSSVDSDVTSDLETTALPSASFVMKPTEDHCKTDLTDLKKPFSLTEKFAYQHPDKLKLQDSETISMQCVADDKQINAHTTSSTIRQLTRKTVTVSDRGQKENSRTTKRKIPTFSSSDSDSPFREFKPKPKQRKQLSRTKPLEKREKFNITKDFFTGKKELQPTLTGFVNKPTQQAVLHSKGDNSEISDEELKSLDLSKCQRFKQETDALMWKEMQTIHDVSELSEDQIQFLVIDSEQELRKIFEGKVKCERHERYKAGGKTRRDLTYSMWFGKFTDEQVDIIMESLKAIFCKNHFKYLDYILKVLLPEVIVKFHMKIHKVDREESENIIMPY